MKAETFTQADLPYLQEMEPPDWGDLVPRFKHFIHSPNCNPVKLTENGRMLGVGTSILHEDTAWLATIIVHPAYRNRGIGKLMTQTLIDSIDSRTFETIYLDATELGYPVYKKLGFQVEAVYNHYKPVTIEPVTNLSADILDFNSEYRDPLLMLDRVVSGECRHQLLLNHINQSKIFISKQKLQGFYMPTLGDGLIIASTPPAGLALMQCRFREKANAVFPEDNTTASDYLKECGYTPFRTSRKLLCPA